jgi:hypothetical protein
MIIDPYNLSKLKELVMLASVWCKTVAQSSASCLDSQASLEW